MLGAPSEMQKSGEESLLLSKIEPNSHNKDFHSPAWRVTDCSL